MRYFGKVDGIMALNPSVGHIFGGSQTNSDFSTGNLAEKANFSSRNGLFGNSPKISVNWRNTSASGGHSDPPLSSQTGLSHAFQENTSATGGQTCPPQSSNGVRSLPDQDISPSKDVLCAGDGECDGNGVVLPCCDEDTSNANQ